MHFSYIDICAIFSDDRINNRAVKTLITKIAEEWVMINSRGFKENVVLCQEKVQIKYNQFPLFVIVNSLSLLRPFPSFSDIVPHIHLETNIHNDYEYGLYYRMFQYIQKLVYMHECS